MDDSDERSFFEDGIRQSPEEMIQKIRQNFKGEADKTINSLDKVVRSCKDWQNMLYSSLCPECKARCPIKNNVDTKTECPPNTDTRHSEKRKERRGFSLSTTSEKRTTKGARSPVDGNSTVENLQLLIKTKESAFRNYDQKTELEIKKLNSDIEKLEEENKLLLSRLSSAFRDREEWEVTRQGLAETIADLTNQLTKQKSEMLCTEETFVKQIEALKKVGLRSVRSGMGQTMIDGITTDLQKLLRDRLVSEQKVIHIKPCQTIDAVAEGPLFVLCLAKSIVGTKVNALEGVPVNRNTVLVAIHYTDTREVTSLTSNTGYRSHCGNQLRQLGGTMDMIFSSASGLYDCDVNNSAVEKLTTFLRKY